jgi:hypothetical protein
VLLVDKLYNGPDAALRVEGWTHQHISHFENINEVVHVDRETRVSLTQLGDYYLLFLNCQSGQAALRLNSDQILFFELH